MENLLNVGDEAPDFSLASTTQSKLALSDYRGNKNVLIAFFPMAFTPG
jgi:peroxiredoxin